MHMRTGTHTQHTSGCAHTLVRSHAITRAATHTARAYVRMHAHPRAYGCTHALAESLNGRSSARMHAYIYMHMHARARSSRACGMRSLLRFGEHALVVRAAGEPSDLVWENLQYSRADRLARSLAWGFITMVRALCGLWFCFCARARACVGAFTDRRVCVHLCVRARWGGGRTEETYAESQCRRPALSVRIRSPSRL